MALTTGLSLMVLRWVTAGAFLYFHAWEVAKGGYMRVWWEAPWPFVEQVREAGFPQPLVLAFVGAAVGFFGGVLLLLGLMTRISAGALVVVFLFVLIACLRAGNMAGVEVCLLYCTCSFLLLVLGPGRFAMDGFFGGKVPVDY